MRRGHVLVLASLALAVVGCGRKATLEDCEIIVDRNVEVQLKALGITDEQIIAQRRTEMRAALKDDIGTCVGKRVTDGMMTCVKGADTTEQLDQCLH